jgi:hypothetical protein
MPKSVVAMSSVTTAVPSGVISNGPDWCIQSLFDIFGADEEPYTYNECFNSTRKPQQNKASFETICCDGRIIDKENNLWSTARRNMTTYPLDLENLVCCRAGGQLLPGGIMPIDNDYTECSASEVPTPLASLVATNTGIAALYLATYESASGGTADWTRTETPTCLWVETTSVPLTTITVEQAAIETLPPPTTDRFGMTIATKSMTFPSDGSEGTGRPTGTGASSGSAPSASGSPAQATTSLAQRLMQNDRSWIIGLCSVAAGLGSLWML